MGKQSPLRKQWSERTGVLKPLPAQVWWPHGAQTITKHMVWRTRCAQSIVFHDFPLWSLKSSSQDIMFKKKEHQKRLLLAD